MAGSSIVSISPRCNLEGVVGEAPPVEQVHSKAPPAGQTRRLGGWELLRLVHDLEGGRLDWCSVPLHIVLLSVHCDGVPHVQVLGDHLALPVCCGWELGLGGEGLAVGAAPAGSSATVIAAVHHLKSSSGAMSGSVIPGCKKQLGPDGVNAHTPML